MNKHAVKNYLLALQDQICDALQGEEALAIAEEERIAAIKAVEDKHAVRM